MVEVDFDKLLDYSDELKTYEGSLPLLVRNKLFIYTSGCNYTIDSRASGIAIGLFVSGKKSIDTVNEEKHR